MRGTPAAFDMLLQGPDKPNVDTLYFISNADSTNVKLYLGSKLIAGEGTSIDTSLGNLDNVLLSEDLKDKSILVYNKNSGLWTDSTLEDAISTFIGASKDAAGLPGLVPAPQLGKTNLFLRSDGTWAEVSSAKNSEQTILTVENESSTIMHQDIINNSTKDIVLAPGDIIIIKDIIANDKWQHTSYVYNGSTWAAMDGNYNAENIYFDEDFIFTENIGTIKIPSSGNIKVDAVGKNLKEFLGDIFAKEIKPTVVLPYIAFTLPKEESLEAGTKISPKYSLSFNKGSYTYDSSTGVQAIGWTVTDGKNTKMEQSSTMPEIQVEDNMEYNLTATARYSDGVVPINNLGQPCKEQQILSGYTEQVTSNNITSYRNIFAGPDMTGAIIDSNFIRSNLKPLGNAKTKKEFTWKAEDTIGIKRFIIAAPKESSKTLVSAIITSSVNADATADYVKQSDSVEVEGANGYKAIEYNVWIYEPASIASNEVHKVTMN